MYNEIPMLADEIVEQIRLIRAKKVFMPKSVGEAKDEVKEARHIESRLFGMGPTIEDKETAEAMEAFLRLKESENESTAFLHEFENAKDRELVDNYMRKFHGQFMTTARRSARSRALLTIAQLTRKGLTFNQIIYGVKNLGKKYTKKSTFPRTIKNVRGQFVIRLAPGKRKPR